MTAVAGGDILSRLDNAITARHQTAAQLVNLGTCPDWGHCQPECRHEDGVGINDSESVLRRCAADRKILELHGGRAHSCPTVDYDGDLDEHAKVYDHEVCPVVQLMAEGYGLTEGAL